MNLIYLVIVLCATGMYLPESPAPVMSTKNSTQNILILGGNGFLGSSLVAKIVQFQRYKVTTLNRGRQYFDSKTRVEPNVHQILCDRSAIYDCADLLTSSEYFDAVVDFSSYYMEDMQEILNALRGRIGRYIFISSDSVYEVCIKTSHNGPSREEDAVRPRDPRVRHDLNMRDYYGHQKLGCEEVLENERRYSMINFISLRLPDVIGPRDTTNRFWNYQLWLLTHRLDESLGPVHLNPNENRPISFVYSEDISELIIKLFNSDLLLYNDAYNVAFPPVTLEEFLKIMAESLGIDIKYKRTNEANIHWYPSVTRGPLNTTKVFDMLNWQPSSIEVAVRHSCEFFKHAMSVEEFQRRRDDILRRYLPNREARDAFLKRQISHKEL